MGKRSCLLFNGCRLPSCISAQLNCSSFVLHAFCNCFTYSKSTNNIYEMSPGCFQMDNLHFWFKERNTQLWHLLFSEHNTTGKLSNKTRLHLALISNWLQKAEEILTIKLFFNGNSVCSQEEVVSFSSTDCWSSEVPRKCENVQK